MSDEVHVTRIDSIQRLFLVLGAILYKGRAGTIELAEDLSLPRTSVLSTIKRINTTPALGVTIAMDRYGEYSVADLGGLLNRDTLISMFIEHHGNRYRTIERARKIFSAESDDEIGSETSQQATPPTIDAEKANAVTSVMPQEQDAAEKSNPTNSDCNTSRPNFRRVSIL